MISIKNLSFSFEEKRLFQDLSIDFEKGKIHGIAGSNGAGKTTFLNILFGINCIHQGKMEYEGMPLSKKYLAYVEVDHFFYSYITACEYLQLFPKYDKYNAERWCKLFDIPQHEFIHVFSTGMKKKLALIGAVQCDKPILLLDEPFNGLDLESHHLLLQLIKKLKGKEKTIIVTSHYLEMLGNLCDQIHFLDDGIFQTYYPSTYLELTTLLMQQAEKKINKLV